MIYTHLIAALVGAVIAAKVQDWRMDAQLSQLKTEYATAQAQAVEKAHAETIRLQERTDAAQRLARKRQSALAADAAGSRDALVSMSHTADDALRRAEGSHATCLATAVAQGIVLGQCTTRLQQVASDADGHASDVQTLIEAWPTGAVK